MNEQEQNEWFKLSGKKVMSMGGSSGMESVHFYTEDDLMFKVTAKARTAVEDGRIVTYPYLAVEIVKVK